MPGDVWTHGLTRVMTNIDNHIHFFCDINYTIISYIHQRINQKYHRSYYMDEWFIFVLLDLCWGHKLPMRRNKLGLVNPCCLKEPHAIHIKFDRYFYGAKRYQFP